MIMNEVIDIWALESGQTKDMKIEVEAPMSNSWQTTSNQMYSSIQKPIDLFSE